jgi:hypothetical protein
MELVEPELYANRRQTSQVHNNSLPIRAKNARGRGPSGMTWDEAPESYANLG